MLSYGHASVEFDDRLLTHLQIVIVSRFRRGESLVMSWIDACAAGEGRSSIWMTPATAVYFKFAGSRVAEIDPMWLRRLDDSAGGPTGLIVMDEEGRAIRGDVPRASRSTSLPAARPRSA